MTKSVPRDILLEILDRFPEGASIEELLLGMDPSVSRRTLQRWLSLLVKESRIKAVGQARARRYRALPPVLHEKATHPSLSIPLSREAEEIHSLVSRRSKKSEKIYAFP